ncbi:MAG TPA: DUF4440 domain-containing protein, partial [Flavisolibacter sp.]
MKFRMLFIWMFIAVACHAQSNDEKEIRQSLASQTESWNRGDIEDFMSTYWKNDSMMFIGKS